MAGGFLKDGINANGHKVRNVADGEVSATSKDAVNGSQLYNVVQFSTSTLTARMDSMKSRLTDDINKVGAGAAAMANLHPIEYKRNDKVSVAAAVGNYKDTTSMAVGAFYRPDAKSMVSVSGSVGSNDNMIGIGYSQRFGKVSEFDGMTDEELQGKVHELSEALKAKDDAFEKRLAQNETKAKAMAGEYCSKGSDESSDRKAGCSYCHKMDPYLMSKGSLPKRRLPFVSASSGQYMAFPTNKKATYIF